MNDIVDCLKQIIFLFSLFAFLVDANNIYWKFLFSSHHIL